jgi:O-antigen/teichoic acid export membrane protein
MHAPLGSLSDGAAPKKMPMQKPDERLISLPYLLLRFSTAGGAFAMGFVQTLVFARVLTPEQFSTFIVVAAIGHSLWLSELGLPNILFINLRGPFLAGTSDAKAARDATAVVLFYTALSVAGAFVCFTIVAMLPSSTLGGAAALALFLLYNTLNLAWGALRSISIAVDLYLFYERLELIRRTVNIATMLALLLGLPLQAFLIGSNILWAILFAAACAKLVQRGALSPQLRNAGADLVSFFRSNRGSVVRSSTGALSNIFITTFPYYVVPVWFGFGAAPIILELTFKIYRGSCVIFAAICDLAVPTQTRAYAARDVRRLVRGTSLAIGLCAIPAAIGCGLLIFAGTPLYAFLLRTAATVPPAVTPIVVALVAASVLQIVAEVLLQYTGFFRATALNGAVVAATMVLATAIAVVAKLDLVGFLAVYAAVYAAGAVWLMIAAALGPIRAAARPD